jgi:hypothetical protein
MERYGDTFLIIVIIIRHVSLGTEFDKDLRLYSMGISHNSNNGKIIA